MLLAPSLALPTARIGVYGERARELAAACAGDLYGEALDAGDPEAVLAASREHNLPVWVTKGKGVAEIVKLPGLSNCVAALDGEETAAVAKLLGWHIVVTGKGERIPEGTKGVLGALLIQHQKHGADPDLPPFRIALETVRRWLQRAFEAPAPALRGILAQASSPDPTPAGEGRRLLGLIRMLLAAGELAMRPGEENLSGMPLARGHLTRAGGSVFVPVDALARAFARARLPVGVAAGVGDALEAAGALEETATALGSVVGWRIRADSL